MKAILKNPKLFQKILAVYPKKFFNDCDITFSPTEIGSKMMCTSHISLAVLHLPASSIYSKFESPDNESFICCFELEKLRSKLKKFLGGAGIASDEKEDEEEEDEVIAQIIGKKKKRKMKTTIGSKTSSLTLSTTDLNSDAIRFLHKTSTKQQQWDINLKEKSEELPDMPPLPANLTITMASALYNEIKNMLEGSTVRISAESSSKVNFFYVDDDKQAISLSWDSCADPEAKNYLNINFAEPVDEPIQIVVSVERFKAIQNTFGQFVRLSICDAAQPLSTKFLITQNEKDGFVEFFLAPNVIDPSNIDGVPAESKTEVADDAGTSED